MYEPLIGFMLVTKGEFMNQEKTATGSLSILISTVLHGSVIAMIAIGPAFLPSMKKSQVNDSYFTTNTDVVDFTVADNSIEETQKSIAPAVANESLAQTPTLPEKSDFIVKQVKSPEAVLPSKKVVTLTKPVEAPVAVVTPEPATLYDDSLEKEEVAEKLKTEVAPVAEAPAPLADETTAESVPVQVAPVAAAVAELAVTPAEPAVTPPVTAAAEPATATAEPAAATAELAVTPAEPVAAAPTATPAVEELAATPLTQTPVAPAAAQASVAPATAQATAAPAKVVVTQNYLGLRQSPGNKPPVYSRAMRLEKLEGSGQLVYFVTNEGIVKQIRLTKSTGKPDLDQAAINAFSKYKFVPGQSGYTVHEFAFSLKGPAQTDAGRLRTSMTK
ncbi:MAG: TonB family protein [Bdellovibrionales bacterium]